MAQPAAVSSNVKPMVYLKKLFNGSKRWGQKLYNLL
jgi:hypothetical protein